MGSAFACFRYLLVAGAIILAISGIVVSTFAGYFIYQLYEYGPLTPDNVCGSSTILLVLGIFTSLIGWCAWQFLNFIHKNQVTTFAILLGIITLIEFGAGIWALVKHEQTENLSPARLEEVFAFAIEDEKPAWDHMQSKLHCCGIDGPSDYRGVESIPWSCCNKDNLVYDNSTEGACTTVYGRGCQHLVINHTKSVLLRVFLVALCSIILHIFFVTCAICYARVYKDRIDKRAQLEKDKRSSARNNEDPDTGDDLLARRARRPNNSDSS